MKVGDLVVRTYGEGQRPIAIIVGWWNAIIVEVIWMGSSDIVQHGKYFCTEYLEVLNESR